jgi:membrane associated rhomboid family serine protease
MDSYRSTTFGLGARFTPAVRALIIGNLAIFVLQHLAGRGFVLTFGLVPAQAVEHLLLWQVVTYMFLHGGVFHLFFNMFALWMFGSEVESELGTSRFVRFYLLSGVGGAVFYLLCRPHSYVPVIGASAAIYGVLVGFSVLFPHRIVTLLLFLVLPVNLRAWQLAAVFVGISLLFGITGTSDGVAHLAHLGGALVGYLYIAGGRHWDRVQWRVTQRRVRRRLELERRREEEKAALRRRVDAILDRINEVGYENLTEEEKRTLREASRLLAEREKP